MMTEYNMSLGKEDSINHVKWEAYRFELVFFNSQENRWQLFQELSKSQEFQAALQDEVTHKGLTDEKSKVTAGGLYRQQIHSLLKGTRAFFNEIFDFKNGRNVFACSPVQQSAEISIDLEDLRSGLGVAKATKEMISSIIKEIRVSLKNEGVNESDGIKALLDSIELGKYGIHHLKWYEAMDLLTCLPFRRHWDIYGSLDDDDFPGPLKRKSVPYQDFQAQVATYPHDGIASTGVILHSNVDSSDSYHESSRFVSYKISIENYGRARRPTRSLCERFLGYEVELEIPELSYIGPFYRCCNSRNIGFCKDVKAQDREEAVWYACYGHLVDKLQFGLAAGSFGSNKQTYVVALPFRVCGWNHYLQLYIRPGNSHPNTTEELTAAQLSKDFSEYYEGCVLGDIPKTKSANLNGFIKTIYENITKLANEHPGNATMPKYESFSTRLNDCLRPNLTGIALARERLGELLLQIRIAAFQWYINNFIQNINLDKSCLCPFELFCRYAPNLARVDGIKCCAVHSKLTFCGLRKCHNKCFSYTTQIADRPPVWGEISDEDWEANKKGWKKYGMYEGIIIMDVPEIRVYLHWEVGHTQWFLKTYALQNFLKTTSGQRMTDQLAWVFQQVMCAINHGVVLNSNDKKK
jgi:hypothetical protein